MLLLARFDLALPSPSLDHVLLRLTRRAHHFLERFVHARQGGVLCIGFFLRRHSPGCARSRPAWLRRLAYRRIGTNFLKAASASSTTLGQTLWLGHPLSKELRQQRQPYRDLLQTNTP